MNSENYSTRKVSKEDVWSLFLELRKIINEISEHPEFSAEGVKFYDEALKTAEREFEEPTVNDPFEELCLNGIAIGSGFYNHFLQKGINCPQVNSSFRKIPVIYQAMLQYR